MGGRSGRATAGIILPSGSFDAVDDAAGAEWRAFPIARGLLRAPETEPGLSEPGVVSAAALPVLAEPKEESLCRGR